MYEYSVELIHRLTHREGDRAVNILTLISNAGETEIMFTSLSSFSLCMLMLSDEV